MTAILLSREVLPSASGALSLSNRSGKLAGFILAIFISDPLLGRSNQCCLTLPADFKESPLSGELRSVKPMLLHFFSICHTFVTTLAVQLLILEPLWEPTTSSPSSYCLANGQPKVFDWPPPLNHPAATFPHTHLSLERNFSPHPGSLVLFSASLLLP